jgi:DNA mismatch repair protein MutS
MHGVATLDGFGQFARHAGGRRRADRLSRPCRPGRLPLLLPPVARGADAHMAMDEATRASLEVLVSSSGTRKGSLAEAVDRCVTGAGARLLAEDLAAPLLDLAQIRARLETVQWLVDDPLLRDDLRAPCARCPIWAARWAAWSPGAARRAISGNCAMAWPRRGTCTIACSARRSPGLIAALLPHLAGHGALVDLLPAPWCPPRPPSAGRAASSPKAMTPIWTNCARRRAIRAAPSPRWKPGIATRPAWPR